MNYIINISLILFFFNFLISESDNTKELPPRFDLSKGINLGSVLPKSMSDKLYSPLPEHMLDEIKKNAKNFIPKPITENDTIVFETTVGTFKAKFYNDAAPNHCLNFKKLANSGFYDGTRFHRVIPNFMIQGGDILSRDGNKNNDGTGSPGWTIDAEFNDIKHKRGVLSMARSSNPNSAGSQFFICVTDQPHLDGKYTAFGKVIDKINIIDHIVNTPTEKKYVIETSLKSIPENENKENFIRLIHPNTKQVMFYKIPANREKTEYYREMINKLRSDNPVVPVIIKTVRVVNKDKS